MCRFISRGAGYAPLNVTFARLHATTRRQQRRLALLGVMLALGGTVAVAHSGAVDSHMPEGMAMCLAVMGVGIAAMVGVTRASVERLRLPLFALAPARLRVRAGTPDTLPRTRAGPPFLQVFLR